MSDKRSGRAPRLSADDRRTQLLDSACDIVRQSGVIACTLDEVAIAAGVSKPLVYKHFANRDELLRAMLQREMDIIRANGINSTQIGTPFADLHYRHVRKFLEYLRDRGNIFHALTNDPGVAHLLDETTNWQRAEIRRFFAREARDTFHLPYQIAMLGTLMTIAALPGAEGPLQRDEMSVDQVTDFWVTFMLGRWSAVGARYGMRTNAD